MVGEERLSHGHMGWEHRAGCDDSGWGQAAAETAPEETAGTL